jgi:hypothetical protein
MKTSLLSLLFAIIAATVSGFGSPSSMAIGGVNGGKKFVVGGLRCTEYCASMVVKLHSLSRLSLMFTVGDRPPVPEPYQYPHAPRPISLAHFVFLISQDLHLSFLNDHSSNNLAPSNEQATCKWATWPSLEYFLQLSMVPRLPWEPKN